MLELPFWLKCRKHPSSDLHLLNRKRNINCKHPSSNPFEWKGFLTKASVTYLYLLYINKSGLILSIYFLLICMFSYFQFCFVAEVPEHKSFES